MNSISFCLSGNVFISPFWSTALTDEVFLVGSLFLSAFWIYYPTICLSLEFGKSSAIYFLNSFLFSCASLLFLWYQYSTDCFSWWTILIVHKAVLRNSRSRNTQLFFTFFHSFLFFFADWITSKVLLHRFFCLIHCVVDALYCIFFLISYIVFFSSRISICFYFMISISVLTFSFCLCIVFLIPFNCLSVFPYSFLSFFKQLLCIFY